MRFFAAKGIRSVKMDDIARELTMSKRTLYELFENKEAVLYEGVRRHHEESTRRMNELVSQSDNVMTVILASYRVKIDELRQVNPNFYADLGRYPAVMDYLEQRNRESRQRFMDFLHRGVDEGYFRPEVNYDLIAHLFTAIGHYMADHNLYSQYSLEDLFHNMLFTTLRGFCTQRGLEVLDRELYSV